MNTRIYHFPEGGPILVRMTCKGQFVAFRQDEEHPRGYGHSILSAIADLNEAIAVEGSIYEREHM